MAQVLKVPMEFTKSTKGTHRFDTFQPADKKLITCIYINKETFGTNGVPNSIIVEVTGVER